MRREVLIALLAAGCGGEAHRDAPAPAARAEVPRDSLVLTLGGGAGVWFTNARAAKDSSGASCMERALEIRRGPIRKAVPLLYSREAPVALNDTAFRATLSRDCAPVGTYRVGVNDAQPYRETP